MRRLSEELEKLRRNEIGFSAFAEATADDWTRMSEDIYRAWKTPPGVDAEDVRQELLLALVERRLLERHDPARQPLGKFVAWQTYTHAKRWLHGQRNALRRSGSAPGRFPLAFSSMRDPLADDGRSAEERGLEGVVDADQLERLEAREMATGVRLLLGSERARRVFDVLFDEEGDAAAAAMRIWDEPRLAFLCEVGSEDEAIAAVAEVVDSLRQIVGEAAAAPSPEPCDAE